MWEQFSAEKNWNWNIKKVARKHYLIGIGKQIGKIGSKKGPESGPLEFPTKFEMRDVGELQVLCNFMHGDGVLQSLT